MTSDDLTATSRFLSYVLRHNPAAIGVTLDEAGWISIETLLTATARHGHVIDLDTLNQLINSPGKRRFESRGDSIRAAQGHSIPIDLQLAPTQPPAVLYHGTAARFLPRIMAEGLKPGKRTHVHLSEEAAAAATVGARRGRPVILVISAVGMHQAGHLFYLAANGVWLTSHVSSPWIRLLE